MPSPGRILTHVEAFMNLRADDRAAKVADIHARDARLPHALGARAIGG